MLGNNYSGEAICGGLMALSTVAQTNEILQTIQIIICIVAASIGLLLTVFKFWNAYKAAKKDGQITEEEKQELINQGIEIGKQIKDIVDLVTDEKDKENKDDRN
jgi:hypothetical protein